MTIRTLHHLLPAEIAEGFNEAFADYLIPLQLTEVQMQTKILCEGIDLSRSYGAFCGGKLVGFILLAYGQLQGREVCYNAGTGVVPSFRGQRIVQQLYSHCLPLHREAGITAHVLEVMEANHKAKRLYQGIGFQPVRRLGVYKSRPVMPGSSTIPIVTLSGLPEHLAAYAEMEAAWQNQLACFRRNPMAYTILGAEPDGEVVGFAVFSGSSKRIHHCIVNPGHRRRGIGSALIQAARDRCGGGPLTVINIDEDYTPMKGLLAACGFEKIVEQQEMRMEGEGRKV